MAVTQSSDGDSKRLVEEKGEPSCKEGADDTGPCELIKLRKSDGDPRHYSDKGPSTGNHDIKKDVCGMVKGHKLRVKRSKGNQDNLSDIDDAEVVGYLNTKQEFHYKRILWEAINGNYTQAKKQKVTAETKKGVSAKKAAKTTEKSESRKPSSRINYDALKLLENELNEGQTLVADSSYGNINHRGSNEGSDNEDQYDISSSTDIETFGHHDGEMYSEYRDNEHFDDGYFDF